MGRYVTVVGAEQTLVDVLADQSVARKARFAGAAVGSRVVGAVGVLLHKRAQKEPPSVSAARVSRIFNLVRVALSGSWQLQLFW